MIRYELPTGKTVLLSNEDWLNLDDEKIQELIAGDQGVFIDDPFADLKVKEFTKIDYLDKIPNLEIEDIPDSEIDKIKTEFEND